jgi:hypothetical protein
MSVYEKYSAARKNMDLEAWVSLLHEDYTFVRHQSNTTLSRGEWIAKIPGFFEATKNGKLENQSSRCIYENHDILVQHDVIVFPDGTKEAVIGVHTLKDGKVIKTETGATPISS